jgi:hypothetical protein
VDQTEGQAGLPQTSVIMASVAEAASATCKREKSVSVTPRAFTIPGNGTLAPRRAGSLSIDTERARGHHLTRRRPNGPNVQTPQTRYWDTQ